MCSRGVGGRLGCPLGSRPWYPGNHAGSAAIADASKVGIGSFHSQVVTPVRPVVSILMSGRAFRHESTGFCKVYFNSGGGNREMINMNLTWTRCWYFCNHWDLETRTISYTEGGKEHCNAMAVNYFPRTGQVAIFELAAKRRMTYISKFHFDLPPGSEVFPPYLPVGGNGFPVVFEMVKDAADDERAHRERLLRTEESTGGNVQHGWQSLTLYRWERVAN